jgi:pyruvate kinase
MKQYFDPHGGDLRQLHRALAELEAFVQEQGERRHQAWAGSIEREEFLASSWNLAYYLALREHDLRPLQAALMAQGLSSLGRAESRVRENLAAITYAVSRLLAEPCQEPDRSRFFAGHERLQYNTEQLFGPPPPGRETRIMVTLAAEALDDPEQPKRMLQAGAEVVRINCAYGDPIVWQALVSLVRGQEAVLGRRIPVQMDLTGPRLRTATAYPPLARLHVGDALLVASQAAEATTPAVTLNLPAVIAQLQPGQELFFDDGKLAARVERINSEGAWLRVVRASAKGFKLAPEKGVNLPASSIYLEPLTAKDLRDLEWIVEHADLVGYSFVQRPEDVDRLLLELHRLRPQRPLGLVLKIETAQAVQNLPEMIVRSAGRIPTALMIARGDLAVELGFRRLAEMQEELLWLAEAAHLPVIWATQVLDRLVKKGAASRAEVSDAVMAGRAECAMLNRGSHVLEAVSVLAEVLKCMQEHQYKKTPKLRALKSWRLT